MIILMVMNIKKPKSRDMITSTNMDMNTRKKRKKVMTMTISMSMHTQNMGMRMRKKRISLLGRRKLLIRELQIQWRHLSVDLGMLNRLSVLQTKTIRWRNKWSVYTHLLAFFKNGGSLSFWVVLFSRWGGSKYSQT